MPISEFPASLEPCRMWCSTAMPEPPPMPTTVPTFLKRSSQPSGPTRSLMASPILREASMAVVLPSTWKMIVMVPWTSSL